MSSLRKRVTSYFRQLSFHNEPREQKSNINENSFVTKYLMGQIKLRDGPPVLYGKSPNDLPNFELGTYTTGNGSIVGCSTGPNGGLTTVKRMEKHLSVTDPDIDFIDTQDESAELKHKSPKLSKRPLDNTTMVIKVAGQEYRVTNRKSRSLGSLTDLTVDGGNTTTTSENQLAPNNNNELSEQCNKNVSNICDAGNATDTSTLCCTNANDIANASPKTSKDSRTEDTVTKSINENESVTKNFSLSKSKSESNPFEHRKRGKIIRLTQRPAAQGAFGNSDNTDSSRSDPLLPRQWDNKSDYVYGMSDSLYDVNLATKCKNGNPIADCYGIIARNDSAILALADGVNWGEKACIAAKSAIHGCLHYLNKTIFDDTSLFDFDSSNTDASKEPNKLSKQDSTPQFYENQNSPIITSNLVPSKKEKPINEKPKKSVDSDTNENRITNTTEVFISLLRAFNCAHNLILENQGMLTTLTVAVVLPLKSSNYKKPRRHTKENIRSAVSSQENKPNVRETRGRDGNFPRNYSNRKKSLTENQAKTTPVKNGTENSNSKSEEKLEKYVCCVCNVGDTLAYVYSQKYGIRELTKGSHDVYCNRDMRDALGALGPVDGINPELNNLTLSISTLDAGDIVLIASDGLTDNYDPTVCKFTVNSLTAESSRPARASPGLQRHRDRQASRPTSTPVRDAKNREKRSSVPPKLPDSSSNRVHSPIQPIRASKDLTTPSTSTTKTKTDESTSRSISPKPNTEQLEYDICDNPLIAHFMLDNAFKPEQPPPEEHQKVENSSQVSITKTATNNNEERKSFNPLMKSNSAVLKTKNAPEPANFKYNFLRSKTTLELRQPSKIIPRNSDGLPYVTPIQKYEITLLLIEDILKRGISGKDKPCTTAKTLCENLLKYTISVTAAKRHSLEDTDLYFDNKNDILVEVSQKEKKIRRKRCLEKIQNLPGKLDHVTVVACNVGNKIVEHNI